MKRQNFIRNIAGSSLLLSALPAFLSASENEVTSPSNAEKFNLKYAPNLDMFNHHAGKDPIDNIKFIHDQGFRAIFDNGLMKKEPALQEKIANELARRGMDMGLLFCIPDFSVASMVTRDPEIMEMLKKTMKEGLEVQKRTNVKTALVVPGKYDPKLAWEYQTANVIDSMRMCCDVVGPSNLILVMEPLNALTDHPGLFLTTIPQAYMICTAVNHPSCKLVNDLYHQQITEGNLIPNINRAWDAIAAFHIGDNPGRNEPGTGEINYLNVFKHIHSKGYDGVLCMEHRRSKSGKEGELAVINAYRQVDNFL
jgi:hydroxypyruvate isomerase